MAGAGLFLLLFVHLRNAADSDIRSDQRIRLNESDALCVLALDVFDKLVSSDWHALKEIADADGRSLRHGYRGL
jgi:hypothetical protein